MLIYLIDDNPDDRELETRQILEVFPDAEVRTFTEADAFGRVIDGGPEPALVVTDFQLKWSNGLEVIARVKARFPGAPVVMFTGTGDEEIAVAAMKAGAEDYVVKSLRHFARFRGSIRAAVEASRNRHALERTEAHLRASLAEKEALVRELNHRTRNNLMTVISLLHLRARAPRSADVRTELTDVAGRIQALAAIQEHIVDPDAPGEIDFAAYLAHIAEALHAMFGGPAVELRLDLSTSLRIPIQRAGPLGLLCYELILDAFRSVEDGKGRISVKIGARPPKIEIEDDGIRSDDVELDGTQGFALARRLAKEAQVDLRTPSGRGDGTKIVVGMR